MIKTGEQNESNKVSSHVSNCVMVSLSKRSRFDEKGLPTIAAITINIRQVASNEGEKMLALINKIKDGKGVITIV